MALYLQRELMGLPTAWWMASLQSTIHLSSRIRFLWEFTGASLMNFIDGSEFISTLSRKINRRLSLLLILELYDI